MLPTKKDVVECLVSDPETLLTPEEFKTSFELDNDDVSLNEVFEFCDNILSAK